MTTRSSIACSPRSGAGHRCRRPTLLLDSLATAAHVRFSTHPVFHSHRSETEMLRYLRKLADRDLASTAP